MRIAQVAPLIESVPPQLYGGTERVVSYLTEELVRQGHDVTLFASGDSKTSANLVPACPKALRLGSGGSDHVAAHILMLERVFQAAQEFDIIHFHIDHLHFPGSRIQNLPQLTTLHGRLDLPELDPLYREFSEMPLVSISNSQRKPLAWANWMATVYHGLPPDLHDFRSGPGRYLAFLGRIAPEKGVDQAIEIAKRTGIPLKIAAKVDRADRDYFEAAVKPLLSHSFVEYVGEIGEREKNDFLGDALALLAPIRWPEPFGLVFIEALACGTPVITYERGSAPEIVRNGVVGFVLRDLESAVEAVSNLESLDRRKCRQHFEAHFTAPLMTQAYVFVYKKLLQMRQQMRQEASALAVVAG